MDDHAAHSESQESVEGHPESTPAITVDTPHVESHGGGEVSHDPLAELSQEDADNMVEDDNLPTAKLIFGFAAVLIFVAVVVTGVVSWINATYVVAEAEVSGDMVSPIRRNADAEATRLLQQYQVVDQDAGVYRIPIDRATQLILEENAAAKAAGQPEPEE